MRYLKLIVVIVSFTCLSGCAMMGITQWQLRHQGVKYSKVFDKDARYCYQNAKHAIAKWNAIVWYEQEDSHIIVMGLDKIYKNCIDTTELGIFFKEESPGKTRVEVSSPNYHLSQYVSEKLFEYIKNPKKTDETQ